MSLNPVDRLGKRLGKMSREQQRLSENLTPEETSSQLQLLQDEDVEISGSVTVTKVIYNDDAFILDHPVQCDLDNPNYYLDMGYENNTIDYVSGAFSYTGTYATARTTLYTVTF